MGGANSRTTVSGGGSGGCRWAPAPVASADAETAEPRPAREVPAAIIKETICVLMHRPWSTARAHGARSGRLWIRARVRGTCGQARANLITKVDVLTADTAAQAEAVRFESSLGSSG